MQTNLTQADKAIRATAALRQLSREYAGRPDVQHAIGEAVEMLPPSSLARLFDLLTTCETPAAAVAELETI